MLSALSFDELLCHDVAQRERRHGRRGASKQRSSNKCFTASHPCERQNLSYERSRLT